MIRLFTISLLLTLCACADQQTELVDASRALRFGVESIEDTKGSIINTSNITSMSVFCAHTGTGKYSSSSICNWMHNAAVTRENENSEWTVQGEGVNKQWKDEDYHSFFAFAPHAPKGAVVSGSETQGPPTLTYTVPTDYTDQVDLLYSHTTLINGKQMYIGSRPVVFGFRHALSKITFEAKKEDIVTDEVTITNIRLSSIINKARYEFTMNEEYAEVANISRIATSTDTTSFSITRNQVLAKESALLLPADQALFMINQSFTADNKLIVTYNKGTETGKTITADLSKVTAGGWDISKAYRYSILVKEDKVTVTAQITDWADQTVDGSVSGTYLNVSSNNLITYQGGNTSKIFYSTDNNSVNVECDKEIAFDHNIINKYISIPSTTPIGDYIFTITAGKLKREVKVEVKSSLYIQIGDLLWATGNLVADGPNKCKIGQPHDGGLYFQWGSLIGWTGGANGDGTGNPDPSLANSQQVKPYLYAGGETWTSYWPGYIVSDIPRDGYGDPCRYYLGNGWRLPSADEYSSLYPQGLELPTNSVSGQWHGLDANKRIWFENAGYRGADLGVLYYWSVSWEATYWSHLNNYCRYFRFYPTVANVGVENVYALGYPIRCVKSASMINDDFIAESGVAAPRIFVNGEGDHAKLMLTKDPTNYGAYFQFMGITSWSYGGSENYQPFVVETGQYWTSSNDHSVSSLKLGKGDPCRLVGYTKKTVIDMVNNNIIPDNKKWRTPRYDESPDFHKDENRLGWNVVLGINGHFFPSANSIENFLPAAGLAWSGGAWESLGVQGAYWTSSLVGINQGQVLFFNIHLITKDWLQNHSLKMPIRCIRQ